MKHMSLIFVFTLMAFVTACQESTTKTKSSSSNQLNCSTNPAQYGCPSYCTYYPTGYGCPGSTTGTTNGGTTGTVDCSSQQAYFQNSACQGYAQCMSNPSVSTYCSNYPGTTGGSTGGYGTNPFINRPSFYVDKNWQVMYPYAPSINCSTPTTPSGVTYTPYETRKGTVTVSGAGFGAGKDPSDPKAWYDPNTYLTYETVMRNTSELLRTKAGALNFFYSDSTLKVRFKANLQPDSMAGANNCRGERPMSTLKGYSKIKFDLYLVGVRANGTEVEELLQAGMVSEIQKCTPPLDLSNYNGVNYLSKYPDGIYLKIKNVKGNQQWSPGGATYWESYYQQQAWDTWGFYSKTQSSTGQGNPYYNGDSYMQAIRSNDCWSIDIEVAADGTKTF